MAARFMAQCLQGTEWLMTVFHVDEAFRVPLCETLGLHWEIWFNNIYLRTRIHQAVQIRQSTHSGSFPLCSRTCPRILHFPIHIRPNLQITQRVHVHFCLISACFLYQSLSASFSSQHLFLFRSTKENCARYMLPGQCVFSSFVPHILSHETSSWDAHTKMGVLFLQKRDHFQPIKTTFIYTFALSWRLEHITSLAGTNVRSKCVVAEMIAFVESIAAFVYVWKARTFCKGFRHRAAKIPHNYSAHLKLMFCLSSQVFVFLPTLTWLKMSTNTTQLSSVSPWQ